jgi:hypothetical protein
MSKTQFTFEPPIYTPGPGRVGVITWVEVEQVDYGLYDLFDQDGYCLNEGTPFPFLPTAEEIREWVEAGKIAGKVE